MTPSARRMSHSASPHVNLHCLQCDSQIGIFANEWIRLTSSFVHPAHPGTHFGTEIATNKTQVVPEGVVQQALEGCTLAEVFCTKCSAAVGHYCKAIPTAAQRNMLNQYLYKLSRTYLKSSETNMQVDPVFGYGGDIVRPTASSHATSGVNLTAPARYSDTPFTREATPPHLQTMNKSQRRSSARMSLQNNQRTPSVRAAANIEPQDSTGPRHAIQDTMQDTHLGFQDGRIADQAAKTLEHDAQIRAISSVLETFRETLVEIKTSIEELKSQISPAGPDKPTQIDFLGDIQTMITTFKLAQANAQELEELRAENAALRAKWNIVQSAMITATGQTTPGSSVEEPHRNSLGKRKRDSDGPRSSVMMPPATVPQNRSHYLENVSSSTQMLTPQSSNHSDMQSADDSTSSRISTPEQLLGRSNSHDVPGCNGPYATEDTIPPKKACLRRSLRIRLPSNHDRHTENTGSVACPVPAGAFDADTQATGIVLDGHETQQQPTPRLVESSLASSGQDDCSQGPNLIVPATGSENDKAQQQGDRETTGPEDGGRLFDSSEGPPMDVNPLDTSEVESSIRKTIEFGDDNQGRSPTSLDTPGDDTTGLGTEENTEASAVDHGTAQSVPARRTRSKKKVESTRDKFDSIMDSRRSVAPEPAALRRTIPRRRRANQRGRFEHATPESIEQGLRELETSKGPRQSKPHIQTTTRILNEELRELGLEDWIERDKDDPEYKRVVEEARERKREQMRLAALASRGISLPGPSTEGDQPEQIPTLEDAFHQAADALGDVSNDENGGNPIKPSSVSEVAARRAKAFGPRRKNREQREEEIRQRDMLAKEAMDMND
ncbi:hypothetical protein AYL99_02481 [Fonsecaea erecta]|uniref:Yippee domain-containing protein n=1 Tax=Fonsecaea erecta TaxID=1367422 RepID=A0A178ZU11_9EURO|nr:hypothetical protein AYL99_02481 [Fonsecaea erecta]OAP63254.1 hypothetical protein AYL99_02481 [Fonsecaea erecta]